MKTSRRGFASLMFLAGITWKSRLYGEPKNALDPNDPTAKALGYYEDHTKVDLSKWPKKAQDKEGKQICKTCVFWTKGGLKAEGREGEWGVCTLFPKGLVSATGWCNSWALKPGT